MLLNLQNRQIYSCLAILTLKILMFKNIEIRAKSVLSKTLATAFLQNCTTW